MKNFFQLIIILTTSFVYSQTSSIETDKLKITLQTAFFHQDILGAKVSYGKDVNNPDKLNNFYVYIKIEGFDINTPIDFNLFSLVELDEKLRHRSDLVNFKSYELKKFNVENLNSNDNFLKYSQSGIINYDHYYVTRKAFNKVTSSQERFYLASISPKKNKKGEFVLFFPVKTDKESEFSLYYKNILIKSFLIKKGERLKFI